MRIFAGVVPRGEGVNCQTTISVHACVHYFQHEHMFITYSYSLCVLLCYESYHSYKMKVADVGITLIVTFISAVRQSRI